MLAELTNRIASGDPVALFVVVTFFCILATIFSLIYQWRVYRWPYVWGILEQARTQDLGGREIVEAERAFRNRVSYTYNVNGKTYKGHRLSAMTIVTNRNAKALLENQLKGVTEKDGQVKVLYCPSKPSKSYLIKGSIYQVGLTLGMAAVMLLSFLSALKQY
jgi:hypothetical protein